MDTYEFLTTVLPQEGVCIIGVLSKSGTFKHAGFTDRREAAEYAVRVDEAEATVYHACAAYKKLPYHDGKTYIARTSANWLGASAFWCDLDCGPEKAAEGKGYLTQPEAAKALLAWCRSRNVALPMLVNSGRGIHAYWLLDRMIEPAQWIQTAKMLKEIMLHDGLRVDPDRSADFSSVLRPVGTHNRKDPANPKPVRLSLAQKERLDPGAFAAHLMNLYMEFSEELPAAPSWLLGEEVQEIPVTYAPMEIDIDLCADKCPQVGRMRDTKGDVSYDHWRGVIGLIKYSSSGVEKAHEWSTRRQETGHTNLDVDTRFNTWTSPPPTCSFFEKCSPELCADCPFKGKIKSPVVLGRKEPEPTTLEEEVVVEGDPNSTKVKVEIPELPTGYEWNGTHLVRYTKTKDGVLEAHPFSKTLFYFTDRICNADRRYEFSGRAHLPQGTMREFAIPGSLVGAGGSKLFEVLGSYEILTTNTKDSNLHMAAFIKDQVSKLMETRAVKSTHTSFGWQENGSFLMGSRLYNPDGSVTEALLSGYAADQQKCFPRPKGTVEGYADRINWLYNRTGMEPMQYMICSMWASPLAELCEPLYNGIPCAMTGASSGKGKTTAGIAALYAFGDASQMTLYGDKGATLNARAALLGALHSLPLLFDEVTNMESRALSQLCYALSNGTEAMRLQATGGRVRFSNRESWRLHAAMTGNSNIGARLSQNGNTEAEAMRIFEIRIDNYLLPKLDPLAVAAALAEMERHQGSAGEAFIKFIVKNRTEVLRLLVETMEWMKGDDDLSRDPKYRFFRNHMACTMTAARIMSALGVVKFDLIRLREFAIGAAKQCLETTKEMNVFDSKVALERMVSDLSPRIIMTPVYDLPPNAEPMRVQQNPTGTVGRLIRANAMWKDAYDGRLVISSRAIVDWCNNNRVDQEALARDLKAQGILVDRNVRFTIGRGTTVVTPQTRCWVFDYSAIDGSKESNDTTE